MIIKRLATCIKKSNQLNTKSFCFYILPSLNNRNILITASLPYINAVPHLGNLIGGILSADVYARYCRLSGYNALFICGTDEYGSSIEIAAKKQNKTTSQICAKNRIIHKNIYDWFQISYNHFGQTSQKQVHTKLTQEIFMWAYQNGKIYEKTIEEFHCDHCDINLADRHVNGTCFKCGFQDARGDQCDGCSILFHKPTEQLLNPKCAHCRNTPKVQQNKHLYFKLSDQSTREFLNKWLVQNKGMEQWTNNAKSITKAWQKDLKDRCITRQLKWGVNIPLQNYKNKVFYVWFDAPIGYISITQQLLGGELWKKWWIQNQTDVQLVQFMGKDNTVFHSILFPAILHGTDQNFIKPNKIIVTQYLNYEKQKFSKSRGIGVFGDQCQSTQITSDTWRFYLLRNRPETYDSEFTWDQLYVCHQKELLNSICNLYQRVIKYFHKSKNQDILKKSLILQNFNEREVALLNEFEILFKKYVECFEKVHIKSALSQVLEMSFLFNKYLQNSQFWSKQAKSSGYDVVVVSLMLRCLKIYISMLEPFIPALSRQLKSIFGFQKQQNIGQIKRLKNNFKEYLLGSLDQSKGISQITILMKEIPLSEIAKYKNMFGGK